MIEIVPFGIFQMVIGEDAMIVNYLIDVKIKNNCCYLNDVSLNKLINRLNEVNIDYFYNNELYNFNENKYDLYLKYSYKKKEIDNKYLYDIKHIEDL